MRGKAIHLQQRKIVPPTTSWWTNLDGPAFYIEARAQVARIIANGDGLIFRRGKKDDSGDD